MLFMDLVDKRNTPHLVDDEISHLTTILDRSRPPVVSEHRCHEKNRPDLHSAGSAETPYRPSRSSSGSRRT